MIFIVLQVRIPERFGNVLKYDHLNTYELDKKLLFENGEAAEKRSKWFEAPSVLIEYLFPILINYDSLGFYDELEIGLDDYRLI